MRGRFRAGDCEDGVHLIVGEERDDDSVEDVSAA